MTTNNEEIDPAWAELIKAFESGLIPPADSTVEYEYRLYYNERGDIIQSTALKNDEIVSSNYVVVPKDIHDEQHRYRVVNGELELIKQHAIQTYQLIKSDKGFRTVKNNPALLLEEGEEYLECEYYDYRYEYRTN